MTRPTCRSLIVAIAAFLAFGQAGEAASPTDQLRPALEEVVRILEDPALKGDAKRPERQARVREAVADRFDFAEMARRAMAAHWRSLNEPQREEFIRLFRALLEHTYLPKIALYQGERVRFVGESVDGDLATVQSLIVLKDGKEVSVAYRVRQRGGRWLVYDISVEGISFVSNYRSQFNEIIRRGSYQELVRRIRQRIESPPSADTLQPPGPPRRN